MLGVKWGHGGVGFAVTGASGAFCSSMGRRSRRDDDRLEIHDGADERGDGNSGAVKPSHIWVISL